MTTQDAKPNTLISVQVVLEYQWTATRDLIADVQAQIVPAPQPQDSDKAEDSKCQQARSPSGDQTTIQRDVTLKSIVESLSSKGFDLEPDQRISFRDPLKSLYVYMGKANDQNLLDTFKLPKAAFTPQSDGDPILTLLIRETGSGLSGQKTQAPVLKTQATFGAEVGNEMPQRRLFEPITSKTSTAEITDVIKASQYARQTHSLLVSQSFVQQNTPIESVKLDLTSSKQLVRGNTLEPSPATAAISYADQADLKRTKERQIRFVVERVSLWRKLYNGVELGNGETVRYSLEDSAKLVGISKKSLDDYLLQLRFGRMYGFDFLKHQCDNIGVLRKFVREHKNKSKCKQARQVKDEQSTQPIEDADQGMADETSRDNSQQLATEAAK